MKSFNYVITDEVGIHARPAGQLAKMVKELTSKVTIEANGKSAEATKLMMVMALGVKKDAEVTVKVEGPDEDADVVKVEDFFKANF
ncbi:MAG: HPr family phosphocarrier protein [Lachnospiraceae bacterium]|nr:HPr family phosphocarrier protein [Lachnospiraceae bacterium]